MFIERLGIAYTRDFVIYDTDDCISIIRSILKSMNIDEKEAKPRNILGAISTAK
jgi:DNA helicase-2/ATP-dependent DNA helicase PcrA